MSDEAMFKSNFDRKRFDAYFTEPKVTRVLLNKIQLRDKIWEPACGTGEMVNILLDYGYKVLSSDIVEYKRISPFPFEKRNFLTSQLISECVNTIITNPPYLIPERFIRHSVKLLEPNRGMVAMLLRNEFDSAKSRRYLFEEYPFSQKLVLTFRPRWDGGTGKPIAAPRHNYSWFIWDWSHTGKPTISYLP